MSFHCLRRVLSRERAGRLRGRATRSSSISVDLWPVPGPGERSSVPPVRDRRAIVRSRRTGRNSIDLAPDRGSRRRPAASESEDLSFLFAGLSLARTGGGSRTLGPGRPGTTVFKTPAVSHTHRPRVSRTQMRHESMAAQGAFAAEQCQRRRPRRPPTRRRWPLEALPPSLRYIQRRRWARSI